MADITETEILNGLRDRRITLQKTVEDATKKIAALDIVIRDWESQPPSAIVATLVQENHSEIPFNSNGRSATGRIRGVKKTGRQIFPGLPHEFTKHDVQAALTALRPEMAALNINTLNGVTRDYVNTNKAKIKSHASGRAAQIYEKI